MTPWIVATLALLPPTGWCCWLPGAVAVQLGMTLASFTLAVTCFASDRSSFIDLSVALSLMSFPGTMLPALFFKRRL